MVAKTESADQSHDKDHRWNQHNNTLVLETVERIVHQPVDGLGPQDYADGARRSPAAQR